MDPWIDNPRQDREKDKLGFIGTPVSKVVVALWCVSSGLGLLWFWSTLNLIAIITTVISISSGIVFLGTQQVTEESKTLKGSFYTTIAFAIVSQFA